MGSGQELQDGTWHRVTLHHTNLAVQVQLSSIGTVLLWCRQVRLDLTQTATLPCFPHKADPSSQFHMAPAVSANHI